MKASILTVLAATLLMMAACKQEPAPPPVQLPAPVPAAPQAMQPPAAPVVPAAPTVVYASADPQHGGATQKVGDYMVELATGSGGQVDLYVQKYEGAVQSFENVQLGVTTRPTSSGDESAEQHMVFFPKDGKLQGTVAGMEKGAYDFDVKIFELRTAHVVEGAFKNVEIDPLETELEPKHDGKVYLVERTKMEVVHDGKKLKVYLRDLSDETLSTGGNDVEDVTIGVGEGNQETVELEPVGDHYEGEIGSEVPEDQEVEMILAKLILGNNEYDHLRMPYVPHKERPRKIIPMTQTEAKKLVTPKKMKGTIGSMKIGDKPKAATETATGKKTKTSKGPKTKGKKAGADKKSGKKKTKTSKGPKTKGKKAH